MRIAIIASFALLAGCAASPWRPFEHDRIEPTFVLTVEEYDGARTECGTPGYATARACAQFQKMWDIEKSERITVCRVRVPRVMGQNDYSAMRLLGHEVLHCYRGHWHK